MTLENLICIENASCVNEDEHNGQPIVLANSLEGNVDKFIVKRYIPFSTGYLGGNYVTASGLLCTSSKPYEIPIEEAIMESHGIFMEGHRTVPYHWKDTMISERQTRLYTLDKSIIWTTDEKNIIRFKRILPADRKQCLIVSIEWDNDVYEFLTDCFPYGSIYPLNSVIKSIDNKFLLQNTEYDKGSELYSRTMMSSLLGFFSGRGWMAGLVCPRIKMIKIFNPNIVVCFASKYSPLTHGIEKHVFPDLQVFSSTKHNCIHLKASTMIDSVHFEKNDVDFEHYEDINMRIYFATQSEFLKMKERLTKFSEFEVFNMRWYDNYLNEAAPHEVFDNVMTLKEERDWGKELGIQLWATHRVDRN